MQPIGVFDSGLGGLSVWRELVKELPNESFVYLADSAHCPYGSRPHDEITHLAVKNTEFLLSKNAKMIVVACNTATAAAIDYLRKSFSIPFIGMEPAIKPAALMSKTACVGVLATAGTFEGRLFKETSQKYAAGVKIVTSIGDGLVELVEQNLVNSKQAKLLLEKYLQPMLDCNADHIVLGCTHYPFLSELINKITGNSVILVDPASAVARRTRNQLKSLDLLAGDNTNPQYHFFTNGDLGKMQLFIDEITDIQVVTGIW
ncbi:MAG: glutamate racemase [Bacteroidales bacterium]|nr:glutamate racemase [Bacteroidales bacterium]